MYTYLFTYVCEQVEICGSYHTELLMSITCYERRMRELVGDMGIVRRGCYLALSLKVFVISHFACLKEHV